MVGFIIIVITLPLVFISALYISIRIDQRYKERRRKRNMKSMYDFWDDNTYPFD